jgi:hypothetical protein
MRAIRSASVAEWIGEIRFDPEVEQKLRQKHALTPDQVRAAVALGSDDGMRWDEHEKYGRRLIVRGSATEGAIEAYLRPIDQTDGLWKCVTAWRL